jgi:hypothetical protein
MNHGLRPPSLEDEGIKATMLENKITCKEIKEEVARVSDCMKEMVTAVMQKMSLILETITRS